MKLLIASDIHGSAAYCRQLLDAFSREQAKMLVLLGDLLYHGPRNDLPAGHNPKGVIALLNPLAEKIYACRGNCEAEVDQMVLNFQCMADFVQLVENDVTIFCTHGHVYAPLLANGAKPQGCETASKNPIVNNPAVIFYGHTHVSLLEKNQNGNVVCNPGSPAIPKGGTEAGFAIYENHKIQLFNLDGKELKSLTF